MRGLSIGLALGLLVGLAAGILVGRSTVGPVAEPPRVEAASERADERTQDTVAPGRGRVTVAVDEPDDARAPEAAASGGPASVQTASLEERDDWTAQDYVAMLERSVTERIRIAVPTLAEELAVKYPGTRVSLDLARRLTAAGKPFNVNWFADTWTDGELVEALRSAIGASPDDRSLWAFCQIAARESRRRQLSVDGSLVEGLLAHELAFVRSAGIALSGDSAASALLGSIATGDPDPRARLAALGQLLAADPTDAGSLAALRHEVLAAHPRTREAVTGLLRELGPAGADIALDALRDDGVLEDPGHAHDLVAVAVAGGRANALLEAPLAAELEASIVREISDLLSDDPDALDISDARLARLLAALDGETADEPYYALLDAGRLELVASEVLRATAHVHSREYALAALVDRMDEDPRARALVGSTSRRLLWDAAAPLALRRAAWDALAELPGSAEPRIADAERLLTEPATVPGALRAHIVEELDDHLEVDELKRLLPAFRVLWRRVAKDDPSAWVRAAAREKAAETWTFE